jgi:hypothetical protein
MKRETYYFQHDYNAKSDQKVLTLRWEFWLEWYALFFMALEDMACTSNWHINRGAIGGLSISYSHPKDKLLAFFEFCVSINLFQEDENGFYNTRMQEHKKIREDLSMFWKKGAKARWGSKKNSPPNAKERKGNIYIIIEWETTGEIDTKIKEQIKDVIPIEILRSEPDKYQTLVELIALWLGTIKSDKGIQSRIEDIQKKLEANSIYTVNEIGVKIVDRKTGLKVAQTCRTWNEAQNKPCWNPLNSFNKFLSNNK